MSLLYIARALWRGKLWRVLLMLGTLFVLGYGGVGTSAMIYEQLYPAYVFGNADNSRGTFLYFMHLLGIGENPENWGAHMRAQSKYLESLSAVESIMYYDSIDAAIPEKPNLPSIQFMAFSQEYLDAIHRMFSPALPARDRDDAAIPVILSAAQKGSFPMGSRFLMTLRSSLVRSVRISVTVQVDGYLPESEIYPSSPSLSIDVPPSWSSLFQPIFTENEDMIIIAAIEPLEQRFNTAFAEQGNYEVICAENQRFVGQKVVALRLKPSVTKEEQLALQRALADDGIGYSYDTDQIRSLNSRNDWAVLKRYIINTSIYLIIAFLGTAGMLSAMVLGAREQIRILRVLGASWGKLLFLLMVPAIALCALACVAGAMLNPGDASTTGTYIQTSMVSWLRYVMPALLTLIMSIQALLTWLVMRRRDPLYT